MSLKRIIKHREIWMGLSILWIVFFHSGLDVSGQLLEGIKWCGYGGVDVFFFASGIGCFYSLQKDNGALNFIKRRMVRIIPTYWAFMIVWLVFQRMQNDMSRSVMLGNLFGVRQFTGLEDGFNWYISAMWLMYFLAPLFKEIVDKIDTIGKAFMVVVFLVVFTVCFWCAGAYIIMVTRIPIFFIGMLMGKCAWNDVSISRKGIVALTVIMIAGFQVLRYFRDAHGELLWDKGFYWYPFILITPGLCVIISVIMEMLNSNIRNVIARIIGIPGKYSFEIYLLHIWLFEDLMGWLRKKDMISGGNTGWWQAILLLIPACLVLRLVSKLILRLLESVIGQMDKEYIIYKKIKEKNEQDRK